MEMRVGHGGHIFLTSGWDEEWRELEEPAPHEKVRWARPQPVLRPWQVVLAPSDP